MFSIDRCSIDRGFRAPTQVKFHEICDYCVIYVKLVLYIIFHLAFLFLETCVVSSHCIVHIIPIRYV